MSTKSDVLRPVGTLEKLYTARQVLGIYNSVIVTATYAAPRTIEQSTLYAIFGATIPGLLSRHPSLCCFFEDEDTAEPSFRRLKSLEVKEVLQVQNLDHQESLAQRLEQCHDQRWHADRKPLWKLVVMRVLDTAIDNTLSSKLHVAFVYHHVIGDGLSGAAFHRSLLGELEKVEQGSLGPQGALQTIDIPASTHLIEPIERLVALPLSWNFLVIKLFQEYAPRWLIGAPPPLWTGLPVQTLDECPFRSRVQIVTIQANELTGLLSEGKKHNVTLTSLLTAAIVSSLADALPTASSFNGLVPYTLRRATGTSMDEMVNQITTIETTFTADNLNRIRKGSTPRERVALLWSTAAHFHAQMQDELARCPHDNVVGLLPYVSDHIEYYRKKIGKPREASFELSNLGVFSPSQDSLLPGRWRLENMIFTQGAQPVGPAFSVNCASVAGGPLMLAITWQESVVDEAVVDAVGSGFANLLRLLLVDEHASS